MHETGINKMTADGAELIKTNRGRKRTTGQQNRPTPFETEYVILTPPADMNWECYGSTIRMLWARQGSAMVRAGSKITYGAPIGFAMGPLWVYNTSAMGMPWVCDEHVMVMPCAICAMRHGMGMLGVFQKCAMGV